MPLGRARAGRIFEPIWSSLKMPEQFLPLLPKCLMQSKNFFYGFVNPQGVVETPQKNFENFQHLSIFWTKLGKFWQNFKNS